VTERRRAIIFFVLCHVWIQSACKIDNVTPVTPELPPNTPDIPSEIVQGKRGPISIYYGLNDSNSTSWVRGNESGLIGLVYFKLDQPAETSDALHFNRIGALYYKTIDTDGNENEELITKGSNLEISVLLYDNQSNPHVFVTYSRDSEQKIYHFCQTADKLWQQESMFSFTDEEGKYIFELTAATGKDNSYHLLVLRTRSNPDSDDYYSAYRSCHLYHLYYKDNVWRKETINNYNTLFTLNEYSKAFRRQDMAIDSQGFVHVIFGEERQDLTAYSSSWLHYATNKTGQWVIEVALGPNEGTRDSAGWYPSLALKSDGQPVVSCAYIGRVWAGSASNGRLVFLERIGSEKWKMNTIASIDDGYYGSDGRRYTGALSHLVFDKKNTPHIVFSDIASSHNEKGINYFNIGSIRYATLEKGEWKILNVYTQPRPGNFYTATEMYGQCLVVSEDGQNINVIGQELTSYKENDYLFKVVHFKIK